MSFGLFCVPFGGNGWSLNVEECVAVPFLEIRMIRGSVINFVAVGNRKMVAILLLSLLVHLFCAFSWEYVVFHAFIVFVVLCVFYRTAWLLFCEIVCFGCLLIFFLSILLGKSMVVGCERVHHSWEINVWKRGGGL